MPGTKLRTRLDYGRRVSAVIDHIGQNLDGDLCLDTLAGIANFSPFHFHRIYRSITGETVSDTVRRFRLQRAATDLSRSQFPIERIARRAGYGSIQAFTRAFSADHGDPPGIFRAKFLDFKPTVGDQAMFPVTIRSFGRLHLATIAHRGSYLDIGEAFEQLGAWAGAHGLFDRPRRMIGLYYDDPATVPQAQLRSKAGLEVDPATPLNDGMERVDIPELRVATVRYKGPYTGLEAVYRELYAGWLPGSGEEAADEPVFEEYLNTPRDTAPSELLTEINLPLRG